MTVCLVTAECTHHYVWLQRTVCTCMSGYGSLYAPVCRVTTDCLHLYVRLRWPKSTCMSGYDGLYAPVCLVTEDDEVALPADQEDLQRHAAQLITPLRHGVYILYGWAPRGGTNQVELTRTQHQFQCCTAGRGYLLQKHQYIKPCLLYEYIRLL